MDVIRELYDNIAQAGVVSWIGLAPKPRAMICSVTEVLAEVGTGLAGDHHATQRPGGKRQVTLIQQEHLPVVARLMNLPEVHPEQLRRNLVVCGLNLLALKDRRFSVGEAVLEFTGPCVPCSQMEKNLGVGGFNAMRGHGGITAKVIQAGMIRTGDAVQLLSDRESETE